MYRLFFNLVLRWLPTEWTHHAVFGLLRFVMAIPGIHRLTRRLLVPKSPRLKVEVLGKTFPGPVGLAAGFDKDARGYEALGALGFGFVEVGTITALPQPGNPKPRMFRLAADRALVNRLGFNNGGADRAAERLGGARQTIVGINVGKSKVVPEEEAIADYIESTKKLGALADYFVLNVSSPNTPGLRNLQAAEKLRPLLVSVRAALDETSRERRVPLLVKIAPDLDDADIDAIADLSVELRLDGIIATNTTIARNHLETRSSVVEACGAGGLSGAPLKERALAVLSRLRARVGDQLVLVAVGGIENGPDAWARLCAGASLVQVYTGFVYGGPLLPWRINRHIERQLAANGIGSLADLHEARAATQPTQVPSVS